MTGERRSILAALIALTLAAPLRAAEPAAPPLPADADSGTQRAACVDAHARAQEARQSGDLQGARELLRTCSQSGCPQVVRADCAPWYDEVDRSLPSLVFAVSSPRGDETDVDVLLDGKLLERKVSGGALDVNPGQHVFRFELPGYPPVEQTVLVREAEKSRVIYVKFAPPSPPSPPTAAAAQPNPSSPSAPPAPARSVRPIPLASYVLAGTALVGVGWGAYFGDRALSARSRAERNCSPICDEDTVGGVRDKALLADLGFGVALVSASAAVYFYLTRPTVSEPSALRLGLRSGRHGELVSLSGAF